MGIQEYVINSMAELEVLAREELAKHGVQSRQAGSSVERKEEIAIKFTTNEQGSLQKHIAPLSEVHDIVRLEGIYSSHDPRQLSGINILTPKLRSLTLHVAYDGREIIRCLQELAKFPILEEVTINTSGNGQKCFENNIGTLSTPLHFKYSLDLIREFLIDRKQISVFKIIDDHFYDRIKVKEYSILYGEIQRMLYSRQFSIERLEKMKEDLEDKQEFFKKAKKFSDKHSRNVESKQACVELEQGCQVLEQQMLEAVERFIASRDYADAGCYFKAGLIQLKEPKNAHELLSKIPADSAYYARANSLMAHILMDNTVFSEIFHPEFEEGKDLEGEEAEKFTREKLKKVIHHLRLAKVEGEEKHLFRNLVAKLVYGEDSMGKKTPFDEMPLEAETAVDFLLDMLREQQSKIKKLESALNKGVRMPDAEPEQTVQNVLRFSPVPTRQQEELPSDNAGSRLTSSQ